MILFKTGGHYKLIEKIQATKVSDKSVWFNRTNHRGIVVEERELKETQSHKYFESFEEAIKSEKSKYEKRIERLEDNLLEAKTRLQEIKNTKLEDL